MSARSVIVGLALAAAAAGLGGCASGEGAAAVLYAQPASPGTFVTVGWDQAGAWTLAAFRELGIAVTKDKLRDDGEKREIEGRTRSGENVQVTIEPRDNGSTTLYVAADKELARTVLARILARNPGGRYAQPASRGTLLVVGRDQAAGWTLAAFRDLGIGVTRDALKDDGRTRVIEGRTRSDENVEVTIEPQNNGTTTLRVAADKDLARTVLARILSRKNQGPGYHR